jgi:aspartyl-tRNA(Asn)/glutamyl-tRNA(Gln) amidotransferase subunit B
MEEGNMRCEPNVSLRPVGHPEYGTKVELKNLNSFRAVEQAIEYEIERQRRLLEAGERVEQETRGWREEEGRTVSQRSKEFAHDYRYFPEPDLPPLTITPAYVEELRARLPELPDEKRRRFIEQYGLGAYEANLLTANRARADYYEAAVAAVSADEAVRRKRAKAIANWLLGDFARLLNARGIKITEAKVTPQELHELIVLIEEGTVSTTGAKTVFETMFETGKPARAVVEERGLAQISAADELAEVVQRVITQHEQAVADYRNGKEGALKYLMGQVMRETRGRANPGVVQDLLRQQLDRSG